MVWNDKEIHSAMKKCLLVEIEKIGRSGHRFSYTNSLSRIKGLEFVVVCPESEVEFSCRQVNLPYRHTIVGYLKWLTGLRDIVRKENPDIIHFMNGDALVRFFGVGLNFLGKQRIVTLHRMQKTPLKFISSAIIAKKVAVCVTHTNYVAREYIRRGIKNFAHIEYPKFVEQEKSYSKKECRSYFGINPDIKVILSLGQPRKDKGLDLLIDALSGITESFLLVVAGIEGEISDIFIDDKKKEYGLSILRLSRELSDDEMNMVVEAADIVAIPYRKTFDGASGPLAEGVWRNKLIIGPNHGSLGDIISRNHLGMTFTTEDVGDLREKIAKGLSAEWNPDAYYEKYRNELKEEMFQKRYKSVYRKVLR